MEKASASGLPQKEKEGGRDEERDNCVSFPFVSDLFVMFMQNPHYLEFLSMEDTQKNPGASPTIAGSFSSREHISPQLLLLSRNALGTLQFMTWPFQHSRKVLRMLCHFYKDYGPLRSQFSSDSPTMKSLMNVDECSTSPAKLLAFPRFLENNIEKHIWTYSNSLSTIWRLPTLRLTQSCCAGRSFLSPFKFEYTWLAPYQKIQFSHISIIPETEKWAHEDTFMSKSNPQTSFLSLATKAVMWHLDSKTGLWNVCLFLISDLL